MIYWPANEFIKTLINTFINFQLKKKKPSPSLRPSCHFFASLTLISTRFHTYSVYINVEKTPLPPFVLLLCIEKKYTVKHDCDFNGKRL